MARGQIEKRGQRRRKLKPVILIVTEGSQTEPKYFEHYRSRQTNIDIRVVGSHTKGGETDYLALIRKAVEYQSKNQLSVSNGDAVWVVADGDVNYNTPDPIAAKDKLLSKAQKMADAKGIHIALSNPCFEFWYLLHFQYAAITEIGKRMRSISPELCKQMTFQVLFYRYYNFDLDQPFLEQYAQNTRLLLEKLRQFEVER